MNFNEEIQNYGYTEKKEKSTKIKSTNVFVIPKNKNSKKLKAQLALSDKKAKKAKSPQNSD